MRSLIRLGVLALVTLAVACGGAASPGAAPAGGGAATVTYEGFRVTPASVEVKAGQTVAWSNKDSTLHSVSAGKPGAKTGQFDQKVGSNGSASVTFDKTGTFDYFCEFHTSMVGTVVVK